MRIEAVDGDELALLCDLNTRVALPSGTRDSRLSTGFSDGALVSGTHGESAQSCTFEVQVEGAGIVRIDRKTGHEALVLDWRMEWMMVGRRVEITSTSTADAGAQQLALSFDGGLKHAA